MMVVTASTRYSFKDAPEKYIFALIFFFKIRCAQAIFQTQLTSMEKSDAAKQEGITAPMIFCEMVLENVQPEKCLFQYFVTEMAALS